MINQSDYNNSLLIEDILYRYLSDVLEAPVYMAYPEDAPDHFYLLEKVGGSIENCILYATFALQSYGSSVADAAILNMWGVYEMLNAVILDRISDVELNSDYNYPDLTRKRNRYQAVFNITYFTNT